MISVIMPVYNVKDYLGRCIQSLKIQTFRQWEAVVVDDGSTDGCSELVDELVGRDGRFVVVHQKNMGLAEARNVGMRHARGDSFFYLDSDDWLERDALSYLQCYSEVYPDVGRIVGLDLVHNERTGANHVWAITPDGIHGPDSPHLFSGPGCDVGHATACLYVSRNIPCELEFPKVPIFEDMIFNMGLMFAGMSTLVTKRVLYHYILRAGSLVGREVSEDEADIIRREFENLAEKFSPKHETYRRCRTFLDNALRGKGR